MTNQTAAMVEQTTAIGRSSESPGPRCAECGGSFGPDPVNSLPYFALLAQALDEDDFTPEDTDDDLPVQGSTEPSRAETVVQACDDDGDVPF